MYCFPFPSYKFLNYSWGRTIRKIQDVISVCSNVSLSSVISSWLTFSMQRWRLFSPLTEAPRLERLSVNSYSNAGDSSSGSVKNSFFRFFSLSIRDVLILFACRLYKLFSLWCCIIPLIGLLYGCFLFSGIWSPNLFIHTYFSNTQSKTE